MHFHEIRAGQRMVGLFSKRKEMKIKDIAIAILFILVVILSMRNCQDGCQWLRKSRIVTVVDTIFISVPDTGWHRPDVSKPDTVVIVPSDEVRHWRRRYEALKSELRAIDDTMQNCENRVALLKNKLARAEETIVSCDLIIQALNSRLEELKSVKIYSGVDTTENYIHHYRIRSHGLLPGGYEYKTDIRHQVIRTTETITNYIYRKNSLALLAGYGEQGKLIGLQYGRTGNGIIGWTTQIQMDEAMRFALLGGVKVQF